MESEPEAGFDATLVADGVVFDARDAALLRAVDREGSLSGGAESLGRSYSRAHRRLGDLEAAFGALVARERGGADGGGSELTDRARALLDRFARLRAGYEGVAAAAETVFDGEVRSREGELGTVETDVGRLRALVPPDADGVAVPVRADAVTLHAPADAPDAGGTSARNRLDGEVAGVERGDAVARVSVDVGGDDALAALVTVDSVDRLGLEAGSRVVATWKATATRAVER
ncbi:TOBE domain-containing protein [Halobacterium litoreum]|uniref:TOBE domain-containing protein n=1 Tax=Halobacterium litoreum TaxID=2039234 RepID=A0ABD5NE78_9EURY|nr:TOBE domain-containing protein [Halobacterium litoreum]UHH13639.1 TOBE domain-containing protein [Halobacterium litoreum]